MSRRSIYNFIAFHLHLRLQRTVSCTAHQRADKTSKNRSSQTGVQCLRYCLPRRNSTSPRRMEYMRGDLSAAACHNITYYAHEQYKHTTRRRCRPKFSHRWQIIAIRASPLDDIHRKLHHLRNHDGASNEPPAEARRRRGGE